MGKERHTQVIVATLQKYHSIKKRGNLNERKLKKIKNTTLNIKQLNPQSFSFVRLDIPTST